MTDNVATHCNHDGRSGGNRSGGHCAGVESATLHATARLVAFGSPDVLREAARRWAPDLQIVAWTVPPPEASPALLPVIVAERRSPFPDVPIGQVSAAAGEASYQAVVTATHAVLARSRMAW